MGRKPKKYNPGTRVNLVVLAKKQVKFREEFTQKFEKLSREIEQWKQLFRSVNKEYDSEIEYLSNFVRHDMKNAIQGLDGIIYNAAEEGTVDAETLQQLKTAMSLLRSSLDNFTKIIPSSRELTTTLPEILIAVETLSRYDIQQGKVESLFKYDRKCVVKIQHRFQVIVQIVNNLVINALIALTGQNEKKLLVEGVINGGVCRISVYDNALSIPEANKERIFEYGYSTTGGAGIGLFHARFQMNEIGGSITLADSDIEGYTKRFIIEFPIQIQV